MLIFLLIIASQTRMAKNTLSSEFRNIDVDQYNEDNYKDDDIEPQSPPIGVEEATVVSSINSGELLFPWNEICKSACSFCD